MTESAWVKKNGVWLPAEDKSGFTAPPPSKVVVRGFVHKRDEEEAEDAGALPD